MSDPTTPFDLTGDLPQGTWLLEASAGTGKTYAIAGLVVRHVAEGAARLDEMLVLTFGRMATAELRSRVRAALTDADRALARRLGGDPVPTGDTVLDHLLDATEAELRLRRRRVRDALADADAATIATTHQFCRLVLDSLGIAGDSDPGAELRDDLDDLVVEVADDLYLRGFAASEGAPEFDRRTALAVARAVAGDPQARLWSDEQPGRESHSARVRARRTGFGSAVRQELERRKRRLRLLSYDDLLSRLADALEAQDSLARRRVRDRWRVVLVDEFQDTDPVQWQVLSRAFAGHATMVLVGDPKQAIYAFRGGDVQTYLTAAEQCDHRATLATSYRADGELAARVDAVLDGAELGHPGIVARPVTAHHQQARLADADGTPSDRPVRLRVLDRARAGGTPSRLPIVPSARSAVMKDLAGEIAALLDAGATFAGRPLRPADVGVLCRTSGQCEAARSALAAAGIRAVTGGGGSVLRTEAADHWTRLLEALVAPTRPSRVRNAATTVFRGLEPEDLLDTSRAERLAEELQDLADLGRRQGPAAVLTACVERHDLYARVMAREDGERLLTDLRHLGEVLHDVSVRERLSLAALATWLRRQREEDRTSAADERSRRLDSDSDAVQVMTIHGSKGLEFPVVMLPSVWDHHVREERFPLLHGPDGTRWRDVGGMPFPREVLEGAAAEQAGEELRLLYVAMTRAQSRLVCWWAPTSSHTSSSPLHRMLLGRTPGRADVPEAVPVQTDEHVQDWLSRWEQAGGMTVELVGPAREVVRPPSPDAGVIAARRWDRTVDQQWRRTSYSALTAAAEAYDEAYDQANDQAYDRARDAGLDTTADPEVTLRDDEEVPPALGAPATGTTGVPSPLQGLPGGAAFGSLVHAVLEHVDLEAPPSQHSGATGEGRRDALRTQVAEQLPRWPVGDLDEDALADGLAAVVETPLGPLAPGLTLATLGSADRLAELDFEIPLAGGDGLGPSPDSAPRPDPSGGTLADLAGLWRTHLRSDDPLYAFADRLAGPGYAAQHLRGYLSGSLDLVLRHDGRYLVADYKTNLLGEAVETDDLAAYTPDRLAAAMVGSTYPLQALLYAVVLHRLLRWRVADYDPESHLGGVLYLYVRGMAGAATPVVDGHPTGVFSWRPPAALVVAASDLLAGLRAGVEVP
ncbi:UvrD-helicase domain-containing protein [Nocardioidaceae bacterium]|nr:UvrD-helicase domain-containing protein [Nocardioidaceae bacterium]